MPEQKVREGQEWSDGQFNYIAYRKADGRMVIRDAEGFDWEDVEAFLSMDDPSLTEVDMDMPGAAKIARWEAEAEVLPR